MAATTTAAAPAAGEKIDTDLYSRQLYVLGLETMQALSKTNVLITGMTGLGVEIAKNVILAGVRSVTVHDYEVAAVADLSSQYYLTAADVGKNRATACVGRLAELNPYVKTAAIEGELSDAKLKEFQLVVVANHNDKARLERITALCHAQTPAIKVVVAETRGLFARIFVDFGPVFTVVDTDGEEPAASILTSVTKGSAATAFTVHDENRHGLEEGMVVEFDEVKGTTQLNKTQHKVTKVPGPFAFEVALDSSAYGDYQTGSGTVRMVKQPKQLNHKSFAEALQSPGEFTETDFAKFGRPALLHAAFQALAAFQAAHAGKLPLTAADAAEVLTLLRALPNAADLGELDEKLLRGFALGARGDLNPMAAFVGGIVAQEVLKISGKFHPISQFVYFDSFESASFLGDLDEAERAPLNSRYDGQIAVFGRQFQQRIAKLRLFLVGCGALGCELLKNFAMMGVATDASAGLIHATDMDTIEKSNLNRQFLFRDKDLGNNKSTAACNAARAMNAELGKQLVSDTIPVGPDTEEHFNDDFWNGLDLVVNALDNIKARLYTDSRCVVFRKPLLESGTLGTKANTQVVLPFRTESYGTSRDPPEKSIPLCTLKNFPNAIEHTIEWARDIFGGSFRNTPEDVNNYLTQDDWLAQLKKGPAAEQRERLETLSKYLRVAKAGMTFAVCVEWARLRFQELFNDRIRQLLFVFPPDKKDAHGNPFWSGPKREPKPVEFNADDELHMNFVVSLANLLAFNFKVTDGVTSDPAQIKALLAKVVVPVFTPSTGVRIKANDNDQTTEGSDEDEVQVERLIKELLPRDALGKFAMEPAEFEKDNDKNFHILFITSCSNVRARNYDIKEADFHATKRIAGRIIPAIATTTCMITGLVCLELYKVIQKDLPMDAFKNAFVNLAVPFWTLAEPVGCKKTVSEPAAGKKAYPEGWTLWDRIDVPGQGITLQQLVDYFQKKHSLDIVMLTCGQWLLYNSLLPGPAHKARLPRPLVDLVRDISGKEVLPTEKFLFLEFVLSDPTNEDADVLTPTVRLCLREPMVV